MYPENNLLQTSIILFRFFSTSAESKSLPRLPTRPLKPTPPPTWPVALSFSCICARISCILRICESRMRIIHANATRARDQSISWRRCAVKIIRDGIAMLYIFLCSLTSSSFCKSSRSVSDILFSKCGPESRFSLLQRWNNGRVYRRLSEGRGSTNYQMQSKHERTVQRKIYRARKYISQSLEQNATLFYDFFHWKIQRNLCEN